MNAELVARTHSAVMEVEVISQYDGPNDVYVSGTALEPLPPFGPALVETWLIKMQADGWHWFVTTINTLDKPIRCVLTKCERWDDPNAIDAEAEADTPHEAEALAIARALNVEAAVPAGD